MTCAVKTAGYGNAERSICSTPRSSCGHDIHERIEPIQSIQLIKDLEPYRLLFVEDPFSPQDVEWFRLLRAQTSVPLAMGELFNNPNEWVQPMADRLFDYIRIHISQIGGITPAMKTARLGEFFGVKTAWHGPGAPGRRRRWAVLRAYPRPRRACRRLNRSLGVASLAGVLVEEQGRPRTLSSGYLENCECL